MSHDNDFFATQTSKFYAFAITKDLLDLEPQDFRSSCHGHGDEQDLSFDDDLKGR